MRLSSRILFCAGWLIMFLAGSEFIEPVGLHIELQIRFGLLLLAAMCLIWACRGETDKGASDADVQKL